MHLMHCDGIIVCLNLKWLFSHLFSIIFTVKHMSCMNFSAVWNVAESFTLCSSSTGPRAELWELKV